MLHYVIETQATNGTGAVAYTQAYLDEQDAWQKYHELLTVAEKSAVAYHAVFIIDENLTVLAYELAKRPSYSGNPVWFVLEFQSGDGSGAVVPMAYTDKADAWNKFYTVLGYAAKSSVPKHGAVIIKQDLEWYREELAERSE